MLSSQKNYFRSLQRIKLLILKKLTKFSRFDIHFKHLPQWD